MDKNGRKRILIADDSELNRAVLIDYLEADYDLVETADGAETIEMLRRHHREIDLVLLDIVMPEADGFDVLAEMERSKWLADTPVIMITGDPTNAHMERAFRLGASDYISRPFLPSVLSRRIQNTLTLHARKKQVIEQVSRQLRRKEWSNGLTASILSCAVEFRCGESGTHMHHVGRLTGMLLNRLMEKSDQYRFTGDEVGTISLAAGLHDIGKLLVPEELLNKPSALTEEELAVVRRHAVLGSTLIGDLPIDQDEPLIRYARDICRWHHERWDGRGYPDGLRGTEIPLVVRVASVADAYDTLVSKHGCKPAFSHERAMEMIADGECGRFDPLVLECLTDLSDTLKEETAKTALLDREQSAVHELVDEFYRYQGASGAREVQQLEDERSKRRIINDMSDELWFEYTAKPPALTLSNSAAAALGLPELIEDPEHNRPFLAAVGEDFLQELHRRMESASTDENYLEMEVQLTLNGALHWCHLTVVMIWAAQELGHRSAMMGRIKDINGHYLQLKEMEDSGETSAMTPLLGGTDDVLRVTKEQIIGLLNGYKRLFDVVRLVDPEACLQVVLDDMGRTMEKNAHCYSAWGRGKRCENCISQHTVLTRSTQTKLETVENDVYYVVSTYVEVDGRPYALELVSRIDQNALLNGGGKETLLNQLLVRNRQVYIDSVTKVYNRRYYDDRLRDLSGEYAFAMIDMDNFKSINDRFGHPAGDAALYRAAQAIKSVIHAEDELVRYGGDEFFLIFHNMPEDRLEKKLQEICRTLEEIRIPEYPELHISASIGGAHDAGKMSRMLRKADLAMYKAKAKRDCVKIYAEADDEQDEETAPETDTPTVQLPETPEKIDKVTWIYNRGAFYDRARKLIDSHEAGYYLISCANIRNFKLVNDQYGTETGDQVLRHVASCIKHFTDGVDGICARFAADEFAVLLPAVYADSEELDAAYAQAAVPNCIPQRIRLRVGRYLIDRPVQPVSAMYDRAKIAANSIKDDYERYLAQYNDSMRDALVSEQRILDDILDALRDGEFEPWFQPQYNHATGAMIGAEALARWKRDGAYVSPAEFAPVLEQSGLIYQMDQYIWERVCILLRRWIDEGREPLPVSVNISRRDIMHDDFIGVLTGIVKKYDIPIHLFRLEITESAFADSTHRIIERVNELIRQGYTVEIDDFGSGYSTLNSLKDVPAAILKLDMRFFEETENQERAGNIVESVVRMAEWLGMEVIAEGVEDREQADFLKSIGCHYIQGYYYARPMLTEDYEQLLDECRKEPELTHLRKVKALENSEFWNPRSMETLIFNSYVGGACIFEFHNGKTELLRMNDRYVREFGGVMPEDADIGRASITQYLDGEDQETLLASIREALKTGGETTCEIKASNGAHVEYLRVSVRIIARVDDRALGYSMVLNMTEQRVAEMKERNASRQLQSIIGNIDGGVIATVFRSPTDIEVIFTNDGFFKLYGFTREQYKAEVGFINDLLYPADRGWVEETVARVVRDRTTKTYEYRCYRRDGSVIWVRMKNSIVSLEGVSDTVLLGIVTDITEEREAQQKLRETNGQLRFLNESAHDILAQPDSAQAIEHTLRNIMQYFAAERAYVIELDHDRRVMNNTYEICAEGVRSEKEKLQNIPFEVSPLWFEILQKNENVRIDSVDALGDDQRALRELLQAQGIRSMLATPLLCEGKLIGYAGVDNPTRAVDQIVHLAALSDYITVLLVRRNLNAEIDSEQKMFLDLMNDMRDGFVRLKAGADGKFMLVYINDSMRRFLRADEKMMQSAYALDTLAGVHPDDRPFAVENIRRCLAKDRPAGERVRCRLVRGDGTYVSVSLSGRESRDEQGRRYLNLFYYLDTAEEAGST